MGYSSQDIYYLYFPIFPILIWLRATPCWYGINHLHRTSLFTALTMTAAEFNVNRQGGLLNRQINLDLRQRRSRNYEGFFGCRVWFQKWKDLALDFCSDDGHHPSPSLNKKENTNGCRPLFLIWIYFQSDSLIGNRPRLICKAPRQPFSTCSQFNLVGWLVWMSHNLSSRKATVT